MEDSSDVGGGGQDQVNTSFIKIFVLLSDGTVGLAGVEVQQLELFSSLLQSPCCLSPGRDGTRDGRQPARTRTKISYLYSHYNHYQIYKEIQTPPDNSAG